MKSIFAFALLGLFLQGIIFADVNEGLVSFWRFEAVEDDSLVRDTVGKDAVGDPYFGVLKATAQIAPDFFGRCLQLNALDSSFFETNYPGPQWDASRTFTAWIKTDSLSDACILSYGSENQSEKVEFRMNSDLIRIENFGGRIIGATPVADGEWHHVAAVIFAQGEGIRTVRLFVDGVWEETEGNNDNPFLTMDSLAVRIGMSGPRGDRHFHGCIDEVRIYDRALEDEEIEEVMEADLQNTAVRDRIAPMPDQFQLGPNFPNPFNPGTKVFYHLPEPSQVDIRVFDLTGRSVRTLLNGRQSAGPHFVYWNGRDSYGTKAPSGVYLVRMKGRHFVSVLKIVLAK